MWPGGRAVFIAEVQPMRVRDAMEIARRDFFNVPPFWCDSGSSAAF
jgi:hypothetical protein